MFAPTKIWRRWHRKISVNQRRYAVSSALAASAVPALVMARGHRIDQVPEFPLVVDNALNKVSRTKDAKAVLQRFGAYADVEKSKNSKQIRRGAGKSRNRRYTIRRGPLVVFDNSEGLDKAFRNLPGVEITSVDNLNLLDLAPGGHLGRFIIWTRGAFEKLDALFGTYEKASTLKNGFNLPRTSMTNADLARIINSDEVQSVVRPAVSVAAEIPVKRNPLKHASVLAGLNPYSVVSRARQVAKSARNKTNHKEVIAERRAQRKVRKPFNGRQREFFRGASKEGELAL